MILAVAISVVSAVTPFVSEKMIDNGILVGNISYVVKLALLIILLQVIGRVVEYVQQRCEINISNSLGEELKTNAFEHGLKLKPSYFKDNNFFKTMSDESLDSEKIRKHYRAIEQIFVVAANYLIRMGKHSFSEEFCSKKAEDEMNRVYELIYEKYIEKYFV